MTPKNSWAGLLALVVLGPLAVVGCDSASSDGTVLPVTSIQVSGLPLDNAGMAWDADGTADVFVEIQNVGGQTIWRSGIQPLGAGQVLLVAVSTAIQVASGVQGVVVAVWDYDTSYTDSQLMARSDVFTAGQLASQSSLTILASAGSGSFFIQSAAAQP